MPPLAGTHRNSVELRGTETGPSLLVQVPPASPGFRLYLPSKLPPWEGGRSISGMQEGGKRDSVLDDHLSRGVAPATFVAALYLGLGEQRHRPNLKLQRGGLPFSLRHYPALVTVALTVGCPPRLTPGTLLCAVSTFL